MLSFWPGPMYPLPAMGWGVATAPVLALLLATFLERPFVTQAGVHHHTLRHSLRANCLAVLASLLAVPLFALTPAWLMVSYFVTCLTKIWYFERGGRTIRQGWIFAGSGLTTCILLGLPLVALRINDYSTLQWEFVPYLRPLELGLFVVGVVVAAVCLKPLPIADARISECQAKTRKRAC